MRTLLVAAAALVFGVSQAFAFGGRAGRVHTAEPSATAAHADSGAATPRKLPQAQQGG